MQLIELEHNKSIQEILKELFEKHGTQGAVAKELGVDQSTLSGWLIRLRLVQWSTLKEAGELEQVS